MCVELSDRWFGALWLIVLSIGYGRSSLRRIKEARLLRVRLYTVLSGSHTHTATVTVIFSCNFLVALTTAQMSTSDVHTCLYTDYQTTSIILLNFSQPSWN